MNDMNLAHTLFTAATEQDKAQQPAEGRGQEIRLLDDLELALAGGGDQTHGWP